MTDILLIIVILMLGYMIYTWKHPKEEGEKVQSKLSYHKILPDYLNKKCEIIVKDSLPSIDVMFNVQGALIDVDDEWLMIEVKTKKKTSMKMIRIENVSSVKEIVQ